MSAIAPIAISSLAEEALGKIVQAITSGEFRPGERLSEAHLARQLGISRGPLREALGRLEGRLVMRTPRIGVSVIALSTEDLAQLFEVREALEGMACRLAAERITRGQITSLQALLDQHRTNEAVLRSDGYFQRQPDEDFHLSILRCAGNARLQELLMEGLYYQLRLYRFKASTEPGRAKAAFREHGAILDALAARDPDAAEAAMRKHIRNAARSLASARMPDLRPVDGSQDTGGSGTALQPRRRRAAP